MVFTGGRNEFLLEMIMKDKLSKTEFLSILHVNIAGTKKIAHRAAFAILKKRRQPIKLALVDLRARTRHAPPPVVKD